MAGMSPAGDVLTAVQPGLERAWLARFGTDRAGTVPADLLDQVLASVRSGRAAVSALADTAAALGVLRAQEGRDVAGLVEDVLALRALVWAEMTAHPGLADDVATQLASHERLGAAVDSVLRATVDAFVEESARVLTALATSDPLTGLLNRPAFTEAVRDQLALPGHPPAMLLVDLDRFKQVNDELGHLAGDAVLAAVARLLTDAVRPGDVVARLGGDEFAVLLPATGREDAGKVARRLLERASRAPGLAPTEQLRVGLSVGAAVAAGQVSYEQLVEAADAAMYRAKRAGGARVETSDPAAPAPAGAAAQAAVPGSRSRWRRGR